MSALQAVRVRDHDRHVLLLEGRSGAGDDLTNFQSKESQVAVGDGIMPVRKMFEALIAAKYQGSVDLEYEIHPDDPMPGVIASFAYMRGVLAGMGFTGQG
jgi:sugar phosphate isomerase/epimerase